VEHDEEDGQIHHVAFRHPRGEVWQLSSSPTDSKLFSSVYSQGKHIPVRVERTPRCCNVINPWLKGLQRCNVPQWLAMGKALQGHLSGNCQLMRFAYLRKEHLRCDEADQYGDCRFFPWRLLYTCVDISEG
jgi:hypothetical protein